MLTGGERHLLQGASRPDQHSPRSLRANIYDRIPTDAARPVETGCNSSGVTSPAADAHAADVNEHLSVSKVFESWLLPMLRMCNPPSPARPTPPQGPHPHKPHTPASPAPFTHGTIRHMSPNPSPTRRNPARSPA
ncbi:unnamed protein product [Colias eurytheme]|nr:unnamed protein product [Colias eurytheme]